MHRPLLVLLLLGAIACSATTPANDTAARSAATPQRATTPGGTARVGNASATTTSAVQREARASAPIVVTRQEDIAQHIGQVITLRGVVTRTKIPTILGVDVSSDDPDLRDQDAEATGKLIRLVVEESDIAPTSAHRGAGVFYRLQDLNHPEADAQVRPASRKP